MKFDEFLNIYRDVPVIDSSTFPLYSDRPSNLRRQVRTWVKKRYLIPLKRGLYIFSENYRQIEPSSLFISNYLVSSSYISLEYALGYYGLIPEKVTVITSVTTKKTNKFKNKLGKFEYRSVKKSLFFGYKKESDKNLEFFIAFPEKAILDYFYLNADFKGKFEEFDSLRFQNLDKLNIERMRAYQKKYNNRVCRIVEKLVKYIQQYKDEYKNLE